MINSAKGSFKIDVFIILVTFTTSFLIISKFKKEGFVLAFGLETQSIMVLNPLWRPWQLMGMKTGAQGGCCLISWKK